MALRFQIPQFIEHEAKIVGPFTLKQSLYLGTPLVISFFLYFILPLPVFLAAAVVLESIGVALNFAKVGGRSLPAILVSAFGFLVSPRNFIWTKGKHTINLDAPVEYGDPEDKESPEAVSPVAHGSKLRTLSTQIETKS